MAGKSDIKAGGAFIELYLKGGPNVINGIRAAMGHLMSFTKAMATAGAVVGAAGIAAFTAATKVFLDTGDALDKMRQRTGISVKSLSELEHAAEQSGATLADLEAAVRKMQKEIASGSKAFDNLGLSAQQLAKLTPEEQFNAVTAAIARIEDPTLRAGAAMDAFGKSGTKLLPMIEDLKSLRQEAQDMGFVMSDRTAAAAVRLGDKLANLWKTIKFGAIAIGEALAPALEFAVEHIQEFATKVLKLAQLMAVDWRLGMQIAVAGMKLAFLKGVDAMSSIAGGEFGDMISSIGQSIADGRLMEAWNFLIAGMHNAWAGLWEGVVALATQGANKFIDIWTSMQKSLADNLIQNSRSGAPVQRHIASLILGKDLHAEGEARNKRRKELNKELDEIFARHPAGREMPEGPDKRRGNEIANELEMIDDAAKDVNQQMRPIAAKQIENNWKASRVSLEQMNRDAQKGAREAAQAFQMRKGPGRAGNAAAIAEAEAEFERLKEAARMKREELDEKFNKQRAGALEGAEDLELGGGQNTPRRQVAGTFSAAAAMALGRSTQRDLAAEETKRLREWLQRNLALA